VPVRRAIELSVTALVTVIRKEKLGEPHTVLAGGELYFSPRFQQEADRELRQELARAGVDGDFRDTLAVMQYARTEYYGWITTGSSSTAALVAGGGRSAVLVVREGDQVRISEADPDRLAATLVYQLPEVPAGRGESISIRAEDYSPPNATPSGYLSQPRSARSREARRLDTLLLAERRGGAQLYAARRDHTGTRYRAKEWITVLDVTGYGRWAVYSTAGRGERAINAVPATDGLLAAKLTDLLQSR
jgi:hypothetical protein